MVRLTVRGEVGGGAALSINWVSLLLIVISRQLIFFKGFHH